MRRIFIIGGAGFIGSRLVDFYLRHKYQVAVYDNFSTGKREFLPVHKNLCVYKADILDKTRLSNAIKRFSPCLLYHFAAIHHIPTCEKIPEKTLRVNIEGTQNVINACICNGVRRIIFISTGAVYKISDKPLKETDPLNTRDIYTISKLCGEQLLQYHLHRGYNEAIIVRLFNTVGRNETNPHIVPDIMKQVVAGKRKIKLGNLDTRRDYVHIEDVTEALFLLGHIKMTHRLEIFNIGSGTEYSVKDLVNLCSEVIGEVIEAVSIPALRRRIDRLGQLADIKRIQQATGWKPKHTLKQALQEIWEELRET